MANIRNRVREQRLAQGLTQLELAEAVGVSRQTINMLENGRKGISAALALRLAEVLLVGVEMLFWLEAEET